MPPTTPPRLPADQIRCALQDGELSQAAELLAMHQQELARALTHVDWSTADRGPWIELLVAQRGLLAELRDARSQVAMALARLGEDHRGARAWLRELA